MPKYIILLLSILLLSAVFFGARILPETLTSSSPTPTAKNKEDIPQVTIIASGLEVPWALAFLPDGNILVTERAGRVRLINENGNLLEKPVATIQVKQTGESGLHGIAIDPKYPDNPYIYLYYTYSANGQASLNKVSRFSFKDNALSDEKVLVDKIPGAIFHDGGRIKFGPDGYLYITTGDAQNPSLSQDKNALAGKILRIKNEGQVEVYSYGHRNPQGITWDSDGRLWETEHGQAATDEINLIDFGKNYGWPIIRGDETRVGMENPVEHSGSATWAPAGLTFYNGSFFFGGLRGQALYELRVDGEYPDLKEHFKSQFGRIRDVVLGPDNFIYITTSNRDGRGSPLPEDDRIIKINPEKL